MTAGRKASRARHDPKGNPSARGACSADSAARGHYNVETEQTVGSTSAGSRRVHPACVGRRASKCLLGHLLHWREGRALNPKPLTPNLQPSELRSHKTPLLQVKLLLRAFADLAGHRGVGMGLGSPTSRTTAPCFRLNSEAQATGLLRECDERGASGGSTLNPA